MSPWNQWWNIFHSCGIWLKLPAVLVQHTGEVGTARFDQAQHRSWLSAKLWTSKSIPLASGFLSALHDFPNNWSRIEPSLETLEVGNGAYVRHACWLLLIFQSVKIMVLSCLIIVSLPTTHTRKTHTHTQTDRTSIAGQHSLCPFWILLVRHHISSPAFALIPWLTRCCCFFLPILLPPAPHQWRGIGDHYHIPVSWNSTLQIHSMRSLTRHWWSCSSVALLSTLWFPGWLSSVL